MKDVTCSHNTYWNETNRVIFKSLVKKEILGHYKNSKLGVCWQFITPILMLVIYYIVFTIVREPNLENFWVYLSSGLFPFTFLMTCLGSGSSSIVNNAEIIKKIHFPRHLIVISNVVSSLIVLVIGYTIVISFYIILSVHLTINMAMLPICIALTFAFGLGYSLLLSSITVYIRDLQYFIDSTKIAFMFLTPMYFTIDQLPLFSKQIVLLNPYTHFVTMFQDIVYYGIMPDKITLIVCTVFSTSLMIFGWTVFHKLNRGFAEKL